MDPVGSNRRMIAAYRMHGTILNGMSQFITMQLDAATSAVCLPLMILDTGLQLYLRQGPVQLRVIPLRRPEGVLAAWQQKVQVLGVCAACWQHSSRSV